MSNTAAVVDRLVYKGFDTQYPSRAVDTMHQQTEHWEGKQPYVAELCHVLDLSETQLFELTDGHTLDSVNWKYLYYYVVQTILIENKGLRDIPEYPSLIDTCISKAKQFCIQHHVSLYETNTDSADNTSSTASTSSTKPKSKLDIAYSLFRQMMTKDTLDDKATRKRLYEAFETQAGILKSARPTYFSQCKKKFLSQEL